MRKLTLLFLTAGLFSLTAQGQNEQPYSSKYRTWSVGLDVGGNMFMGDLKGFYPDSDVDGKNIGYGASIYVNKWFNHLVGLSGSLGYNQFTGKTTNFYFSGDEMNMALDLTVNISSLINKGGAGESRWSWIPYAGWGIASANPALYDVDDNLLLERDDRYNEAVFRGGLLVKYKLSQAWDLDFRYLAHYTMFTDWNDGVSSGRSNDGANHLRVGVTYNFGSADKSSIVYARPLGDMYDEVAGVKDDMDQLTTDSDGDGVADYFDKENDTPDGYMVDGSGRAMDIDRDGISDDIDQDPFTPRGAKVDATGREVDTDGDGVADSHDLEPDTESGKMVNFQGRTITSGMSGAMAEAFLPTVHFAFNSATVTSANEQRLATIARIMKNDDNVTFKVVGHADPVGSEKYNLNLSERRAKAVVKILVNSFGIDEGRFEVVGAGEGELMAENNMINRRVEFKLK